MDAISPAASTVFEDSTFRVRNDVDTTKVLALDCSAVTTGQTRTLIVPNGSGVIVLRSAPETLSNKVIGTGWSMDDADISHRYTLTPGNLTQNVVLNIPPITLIDAADTLVLAEEPQALVNKTLTSPLNLVRASELGTTGASVALNAGAPPTAGQVLTASSATAAAWATVAAPPERRTWLASTLIDCTNNNETEYAPTIKDLSPAAVGCWVMPRAATVTAVTVILLGAAAGTITAGTMSIGIGTRSLGDVYTNVATVGTLTSVLNANGQLVVSGLAHAFAAGDRVVLRLTTDATFDWSNGANNDASVLVEFSSA